MMNFDFTGQDPAFQQSLRAAGFAPHLAPGGYQTPFAPAFAAQAPQPQQSAAQSPFAGGVADNPGSGAADPGDLAGIGPRGGLDDASLNGLSPGLAGALGPEMSPMQAISNVMGMMGPIGMATGMIGAIASPTTPSTSLRSALGIPGLTDIFGGGAPAEFGGFESSFGDFGDAFGGGLGVDAAPGVTGVANDAVAGNPFGDIAGVDMGAFGMTGATDFGAGMGGETGAGGAGSDASGPDSNGNGPGDNADGR